MTNLYFVRHAHSIYTPDEVNRPLSEHGCNDAKRVTDLLKEHHIDFVLSSPFKRAMQTVEGAAHFIDEAVLLVDGFKERLLSSQPVDDFGKAIEKVWLNESFAWEGGESNQAAQKRGVDATLQVLEKHADQNIVIGTHGNIMVLIMNYFEKAYHLEFWKQLHMPDIYKLSFEGTNLKTVSRIWNDEYV